MEPMNIGDVQAGSPHLQRHPRDTGVKHLYIHIPFCHRRCAYCDFNTYANMEDRMAAYVDALCAELEIWRQGDKETRGTRHETRDTRHEARDARHETRDKEVRGKDISLVTSHVSDLQSPVSS